jgi:AcrR family transcriptional regulator
MKAGWRSEVQNTVNRQRVPRDLATTNRLVDAVLGIWEIRGSVGISARLIAQSAGLPVSSIYYHFGDLERLLLSAHEQARVQAEEWCGQQLAMLPETLAPASETMPSMMAVLIADWCDQHRRLAFAWRECQLVAARDAGYMPALQAWQRLWASFWEDVCNRCGVPETAELTRRFFESESFLHLIRWRPIIDRACLDELCRAWGRWLSGALSDEGPWRQFARLEAGRTMSELLSLEGVAGRIAAAAADILTRLGPASLTHRAVALEAGVTVGVVSYNFRTSADLVKIAFETIYSRVMVSTVEGVSASPRGKHAEYLEAILAAENTHEARMYRLAMSELLVAVARDETLNAFAIQIRYLRGRTSKRRLAALLGQDVPVSSLDAALLSDMMMGIECDSIGLDEDAKRNILRRGLQQIENLLSPMVR